MEMNEKVLEDVIGRLRKVEGQIGGIVKMIESGRGCTDVVTQISAASKALDRAGFRLIASGLRDCIANPKAAGKQGYDEDLYERLFLKLT